MIEEGMRVFYFGRKKPNLDCCSHMIKVFSISVMTIILSSTFNQQPISLPEFTAQFQSKHENLSTPVLHLQMTSLFYNNFYYASAMTRAEGSIEIKHTSSYDVSWVEFLKENQEKGEERSHKTSSSFFCGQRQIIGAMSKTIGTRRFLPSDFSDIFCNVLP